MSGASEIEWCDATWNPTRGCRIVDDRCANCYAMRQARRHDHPGGSYEGLTRMTDHGPVWNGVVRPIPEALDWPLRYKGDPRARAERRPTRIFVDSMSDLFHEGLDFEWIAAVFGVMACSPHVFQVLTKRIARALDFFDWLQRDGPSADVLERVAWAALLHGAKAATVAQVYRASGGRWPLPNVQLGISVSRQADADRDVPLLLRAPAAVRSVSYEPALGPVDFRAFVFRNRDPRFAVCPRCLFATNLQTTTCPNDGARLQHEDIALDWVIVGGESGPGARPFDLAWARSSVTQCRDARVPVFVKQLGARPIGNDGAPLLLQDRKGGDMAEWPPDVRVREFPS